MTGRASTRLVRLAAVAVLALLWPACTDSLASTQQAVAAVPWVRHTIASDLVGADGHALGDVDGDGDADVAVAWEESSRVTVYARPADPRGPWPLLASYAHSSAEDVVFCDLDGDGWRDVVSAGEDRKVRVARNLGGTFAAPVVVGAATNVQQWTQLACADLDGDGALELVAGGRIASAGQVLGIYRLTSPTPWVASGWTKELLGAAGWTMTLAIQDVDADALPDVLYSDRLQAAPAVQGTRYLTRISGAWASVVLEPVSGGYIPRYIDRRRGPGRLLVGSVKEADQTSIVTVDGVPLPYPWSAGPYHAGRLVDLDGDGWEDVVTTPGMVGGIAPPASAGPRWFRGPDWTEVVVADGGGKWDEVDVWDVDADGDLDLVSTEQLLGGGVVWLEQP